MNDDDEQSYKNTDVFSKTLFIKKSNQETAEERRCIL